MKKLLALTVLAAVSMAPLSGCAVVSNMRTREGDTETHMVAVFGLPLWVSTQPVDREAESDVE